MSGSDKTVEYAITGDPSGFQAAMEASMRSLRDATSQIGNLVKGIETTVNSSFKGIENQMKGVADVFKSVTAIFGALTAVVAGGSAFKAAITESAAWSGEAKKLSMQLGMSTERASVLMVAMRHLGLESDLVTTASTKMSKQIFTNGQAFEKLGVQVKDSNGEYRPTITVMAEVNEKLKAIKNPIEQNIAGMQVYGRGWQEIRGMLKLTSEEMVKAEQKTKDLGLLVGEEGAAQARKYKESMNDMKLVLTSLEVQLGGAVMPAFVELGAWLSGIGPTAGKVMGAVMESFGNIMSMVGEVVMEVWGIISSGFKDIGRVISEVMGSDAPGAMEIFINVLKLVEIAFAGLRVAFQIVIEAVMMIIEGFVARIMQVGAVWERVSHFDFSGAKAAWNTGTKDIEAIAARHGARMVEIAREGQERIDSIANRGAKSGPKMKDKDTSGGPRYDFEKDGKDKSKSNVWEEKLALMKDAFEREQQLAGTMQEFGKARERDYWKNILDTVAMSADQRVQINRKYLALEHDLRKDAFDSEIAGERAKLEEFRYDFNERITIAQRIFADMKQRYGADSKEAKAAMGDIAKEKRKLAEQALESEKIVSEARRNAAAAEIDFAQKDAELRLALGDMTTAKLLELESSFEMKRYEIKMQEFMREQALLMQSPDKNPVAKAALDAKMEQLELQHQMKLREIKGKTALEDRKYQKGATDSIQSGMQGVISGTLQGNLKLRDIWKNTFQVLAGAVGDMLAKMAVDWAMNLIKDKLMSQATALSQISANAGVAGAAATASAAAIPFIGWMIAPEAGLAASAAAMAYAPMAAASGGYDIPAGLSPITQLHPEEMVLPAPLANTVRDAMEGGSGGGFSPVVNVYAMDHRDVKRSLKQGGALHSTLRDLHRDFVK